MRVKKNNISYREVYLSRNITITNTHALGGDTPLLKYDNIIIIGVFTGMAIPAISASCGILR